MTTTVLPPVAATTFSGVPELHAIDENDVESSSDEASTSSEGEGLMLSVTSERQRVASGVSPLDRLLGGLYIGDNVVWHDDAGSLAVERPANVDVPGSMEWVVSGRTHLIGAPPRHP